MSSEKEIDNIKYLIEKNGGFYYRNLDEEHKNNHEIALFAIQKNPNLMIMAKGDKNIQDSKDIALLELKHNGRAIGFLSERLRADKELGLLACDNFGAGIKYLSSELKNDEDIVSRAVDNDPFAIFLADTNMLSNKTVLDIALNKYLTNTKFYDSLNETEQIKFFKNYQEKKELYEKFQTELPKQDDISRIENIDIEKLHAEILERNKTVIIPDTYITEMARPKEEVKLSQESKQVQAPEVSQITTPLQQTNPRRMKL